MKKYKIALAAFSMLFTCSGSVNAQTDLGKLLGKLVEHSSKTDKEGEEENDDNKKNDLFEGLSNIFNKDKIANESDLVGTWKFSGPAIILESEGALEKMGGKVAAQRMETKINDLLVKYDLIKEAMTIEFNEDGKFTQTYKKIKLPGTYSIEEQNVILKYAGKFEQLVGETQIDGSNLVIVMDIQKLNEHLISLTKRSTDPKVQVITKLLSKVKGMKCGMRFDKQ